MLLNFAIPPEIHLLQIISLPPTKEITHRQVINWPHSVLTLQGKHWEEKKKKKTHHPTLFCSKHMERLNTNQQIVCSGAEVSDMFQKHQKTWVTKGHMHKCTQRTQATQ